MSRMPTITATGRPAPTRLAALIALRCAVADVAEEKRLTMATARRQATQIRSANHWGAWVCLNRRQLAESVFTVRWDQPGHDGAKAAALAAMSGYLTTHPTELADEAAAAQRARDAARAAARVRTLRRVAWDRATQAMASFDPTDPAAVQWMRRAGQDPATYGAEVVGQLLEHYAPKVEAAEAELEALGGAA